MTDQNSSILLLGSNVSISNLPIKEVSLLKEGALPAYGYNPGDFIELLAGPVKVEAGRLEQCQTWLSAHFEAIDNAPKLKSYAYGTRKKVYQIFRKKEHRKSSENMGWFMFQQILPPEGRSKDPAPITIDKSNRELFSNNLGVIIIDDSGRPPEISDELNDLNPNSWVIGIGISVVHWQNWAKSFGNNFCLFCRLADLETTRMEMDSSMIWESMVAMAIRSLKSSETKLWDDDNQQFLCHIIIEMFPHGILYLGPDGIFFRHRKLCLPNKSSSRHIGSVPCYDTMVTSLLAMDWTNHEEAILCRNYFFDFSNRVMENWQQLFDDGYHFNDGLEFPKLTTPSAGSSEMAPCSNVEDILDPYFIELPASSDEFDQLVDVTSCQTWNDQKKKALRSFFPIKSPYSTALTNKHGVKESYLNVILEVLHHLKEEVSWKRGFEELRLFSVGNLRTTDPVEIEPIMTLQNVMDSYVSRETFHRPLCVGVFGPPGSGKSFSVKEVARMIAKKFDTNPFDFFEFNLTQFENPEEINSAIEPIRASVAKGKVPIVFWDEFDCQYDNNEFGYLRYFLPSMQDGVTYVHGTPYNIGRSIFVFAGGIKSSWDEMEHLLNFEENKNAHIAKTLKIPDFMSRLRVVIDIDGIKIPEHFFSGQATSDDLNDLRRILLKRAFIIAHQMDTHWKKAARKTSGLLLRLLIAEYKYGARSIEAVIEASGAADRLVYGLPELIAPSAARIHANWRIGLEREVDQIRKQQQIRAIW